MKRFFYILFISVTVLFSFGFRGCELEYCQFLFNVNYAVHRVEAEEGWEYFTASDSGIYTEDVFQCLATLVGRDSALNLVKKYVGLIDGANTYCSVGNSGTVVLSPDGGNTWENRSIPGVTENLYGLDFLYLGEPEPGLVVCGQAGSMNFSTNSGLSWEPVNTPTTENLNSVAAIDKSLFIVVGDGGTILKTYDRGGDWENHTVGGAKFNSIFDGIKVEAYGYLWIAGDNGRIYATTNYGINWFPQNSGVTENLNDIQFRNQNEGMVVGNNGVVRITTNGGTTWQSEPYFDGLTDGDIISLATADFNTGLAVVRNTTLDGSTSSSIFVVSSEPLAVDDNNNIIPSEYTLEQNYPNPFNPSTVIGYQLPVSSSVTLKIYDLLGREVAALVNEYKPAGKYETEFDASELTSGIYFYKLSVVPTARRDLVLKDGQAGNFSQTKKLILMK